MYFQKVQALLFFLGLSLSQGIYDPSSQQVVDKKFSCLRKILLPNVSDSEFNQIRESLYEDSNVGSANMTGSNLAEMEDVKDLLVYYEDFSLEIKQKVRNCALNLAPAIERCNLVHRKSVYRQGKRSLKLNNSGNAICIEMTPTYVIRSCPRGFHHLGCCHCVLNCPKGYKDIGFHCIKPAFKIVGVFEKKQDCGANCEPYGIDKYVKHCPRHYHKAGVALCIPSCPAGWHDEGTKCRKPGNIKIGHPFTWTLGDN